MGLKHTQGRIIAKVNLEQKNNHTFADGTTIRLERQYNNFDRKHTEQVLGEVISAEDVPMGAFILFNHNSLHAVNQVFNHSNLSGEEAASEVKIFAIPEMECYLWKMPEEKTWHPIKPYETALRIFEPYTGVLEGIEPKKLKDTLFVTSGELKGKVVKTLKACDYCVIFRNEKGVEETIIRFRPFGDTLTNREEEAIAILNEETEKVLNGELLVGIEISDAKPIEINAYAD